MAGFTRIGPQNLDKWCRPFSIVVDMKIVLGVVGITLAVVITAVAGVYAYVAYTTPVASPKPAQSFPPVQDKTPEKQASKDVPQPVTAPTPPMSTVQAPPQPDAMPKASGAASNPTAPSADPAASPPAASIPPTATGALPPIPVPHPSPTPVQPGAGPALSQPDTRETAPGPVATFEKLSALQIGMTEDQVSQIMGSEGHPPPESETWEYQPIGWYELRWTNRDGGYISGLFTDNGILGFLEQDKIPGGEALETVPYYAIRKWLNERMRTNRMPVRVPAVEVVELGSGGYGFQGMLVSSRGEVWGSISGTYYIGDNITVPYLRAMEGQYEYVTPDGIVFSEPFQFAEQ